jgi:hypothetical protein
MPMNRSMPPSTVIRVLAYPDVGKAVGWLCQTNADVAPEDWGGTSRRL